MAPASAIVEREPGVATGQGSVVVEEATAPDRAADQESLVARILQPVEHLQCARRNVGARDVVIAARDNDGLGRPCEIGCAGVVFVWGQGNRLPLDREKRLRIIRALSGSGESAGPARCSHRLEAQDTALSRLVRGFESLWERH